MFWHQPQKHAKFSWLWSRLDCKSTLLDSQTEKVFVVGPVPCVWDIWILFVVMLLHVSRHLLRRPRLGMESVYNSYEQSEDDYHLFLFIQDGYTSPLVFSAVLTFDNDHE